MAFIRSVLDVDGHACTDLSGILSRHDVESICQPDDVHLNGEGNRVAAAAVTAALQPVLAGLMNGDAELCAAASQHE